MPRNLRLLRAVGVLLVILGSVAGTVKAWGRSARPHSSAVQRTPAIDLNRTDHLAPAYLGP